MARTGRLGGAVLTERLGLVALGKVGIAAYLVRAARKGSGIGGAEGGKGGIGLALRDLHARQSQSRHARQVAVL